MSTLCNGCWPPAAGIFQQMRTLFIHSNYPANSQGSDVSHGKTDHTKPTNKSGTGPGNSPSPPAHAPDCRCCLWDINFQFLATYMYILYQDDLKNGMNSSFSSHHPGEIHPFLYIILLQKSCRGNELNNFCPKNSSDDLCLLFCLNPSSMHSSIL